MATKACIFVQDELMFLGDILSIGIVRKGLEKVGSHPDTATPTDLDKALDKHIAEAITSFVGPAEAKKINIRLKKSLSEMKNNGGTVS